MISPASSDLRAAAIEALRLVSPATSPIGPISPIVELLAPADESAAIAAVQQALSRQQAVYPQGGGTSLGYGLPRSRPGVALSLACLNRVIDYAPDDMTVTVEAGITLAELNRRLAEKSQWLPLDPPAAEKATIGGIIATNASGPRRHSQGTIGDYLIGFRAIDGRGEVYCGGGKVVKNAAGYNLPRLMVGACGTLGVITQATFMVRPLPTAAALVIGDLPSFEQAENFIAGLAQSHTTPAIVELLAGPARVNCPMPAQPSTAAVRLVIGFEGGTQEVQAMQTALCGEWQATGVTGLTTLAGAGVGSVFEWLAASPAMLQFNVLPSRLVALMEQVARALPGWPLQAHAGSGVLLAYSPHDGVEVLAGRFAALVGDTLRPLAAGCGGFLTVLAAPDGVELSAGDIWGPPRPAAALMQAIQQRFDPEGILNPTYPAHSVCGF